MKLRTVNYLAKIKKNKASQKEELRLMKLAEREAAIEASMKKNHYYFIYKTDGDPNKMPMYVLCDTGGCAESADSFDIPFNELATNELLVDHLMLISMFCKEQNGARWFASYLSAFSNNDEYQYEKLMTNPTIRVLVCNKELREKFKQIPGLKWNKAKRRPKMTADQRQTQDDYEIGRRLYPDCDATGEYRRSKI